MLKKQEENILLSSSSENSLDSICPVVLIATHRRVEITSKLIKKLSEGHPGVKIVLVVSLKTEQDYFNAMKIPDLHVIVQNNQPLGLKWQTGVNYAKKLKANPLIICGSDDVLEDGFIANACKIILKYDFIGLKRFYVLHKRKKYLIEYKPAMPIGGGRVYSKALLDTIRWKVFDPGKNKHLDDEGWKNALYNTDKILIVSNIQSYGLVLTAVKGNWPMLNQFNPYHPNISVVCVE